MLYPFVLFRGVPSLDLYLHELRHIRQIRRDGVFVFYVKYLWWSIRYGYEKNPYEVEARNG